VLTADVAVAPSSSRCVALCCCNVDDEEAAEDAGTNTNTNTNTKASPTHPQQQAFPFRFPRLSFPRFPFPALPSLPQPACLLFTLLLYYYCTVLLGSEWCFPVVLAPGACSGEVHASGRRLRTLLLCMLLLLLLLKPTQHPAASAWAWTTNYKGPNPSFRYCLYLTLCWMCYCYCYYYYCPLPSITLSSPICNSIASHSIADAPSQEIAADKKEPHPSIHSTSHTKPKISLSLENYLLQYYTPSHPKPDRQNEPPEKG